MTDIIFAQYQPNTGTVRALAAPLVFATAAASAVRVRGRPQVHAAGAARLTGTVSVTAPRGVVRAWAGGPVVFARQPARVVSAHGVQLTPGHVSLLAPRARVFATAAGAGVYMRCPAAQVTAFNAASPPPSGYVSLLAPRCTAAATGHENATGSVAAKGRPRVMASAAANFVRLQQPQRVVWARNFAPGARTGALQPNYPIFAGAVGTPWPDTAERLVLGDSLSAEIVYNLTERVRVTDASVALLDALLSLGERMAFADVAGIAWQVLMAETIGLAGDHAAWRAVTVEIADALALAAGARSTLDATIALASAMAFGDSLANVVQADIAESLTLTDAQKTTLAATVKMLDGMRLADSLPMPSMTLTAQVDENLALGADLNVQQELAILLRDGVQFLTQFALDDGVYLAWVMNAETHAFTSYSNYPFNSFATIGGKTYGAKADGIYLLEGDTDAGAAIDAFARGGLTDLDSSKFKRMPSAYLGMTTNGRMVLKVTVVDDAGARQEHWYALEDRPAGALRMGRVKLGRGLKSTYWGFELANVDGADFALDEISWYPLVLDRRL